jgi:uncharacterized protein (DUF362 family)
MSTELETPPLPTTSARRFDRRKLLTGAAAAGLGIWAYPHLRRALARRAAVFVARGQRYDGPLRRTIEDGLRATGIDLAEFRGKRVLLKPNLVEPSRSAPHMTTHPAVVVAAAEVFRAQGALVSVGEAPGHVRDTEMALAESDLGEALWSERLPFADLNYEESTWVRNRGRASKLQGFYFPRSVAEADLVVSLPKLKTHHWVGLTAAMKNMYGWPKNVLHHAGIPETVFDINASLPRVITVVDGILCMEGDGPIMGSPKPMGLILVGAAPASVDATAARIMHLNPSRVSYLRLAEGRLGPLDDALIDQRGEAWRSVATPFSILDEEHLRGLRADPAGALTS